MGQPILQGPGSSQIEVPVDYGFERLKTIFRSDHTTKTGDLYTYIEEGSFTGYSVPVNWITQAQRALINSWWETGTTCQFWEDGDSPTSFHNVRIMGDEEPLQTYIRPYFQDLTGGEIILQTV
ncbi:hypothetical protein CMI41_04895 [Candidatus Pacearchaeota archaeon]|nr:hypothetical protein [Candidatus Pacearchaeota archaeon]|tara:strand:+ start:458 stop:826 length:369 start_codon:yes stop_codon:yes gene_type:complete